MSVHCFLYTYTTVETCGLISEGQEPFKTTTKLFFLICHSFPTNVGCSNRIPFISFTTSSFAELNKPTGRWHIFFKSKRSIKYYNKVFLYAFLICSRLPQVNTPIHITFLTLYIHRHTSRVPNLMNMCFFLAKKCVMQNLEFLDAKWKNFYETVWIFKSFGNAALRFFKKET